MLIQGVEFIDYEQAAAMCGCGRTFLQRLVSTGQVGSARPGRKRLINRRDLAAWLEGKVAQARRPVGKPRARR